MQWYKINSKWAASTIQRKATTKKNSDLDIFQCEYPMKLCSLLLSTVSHFWCIDNSSAPQFCANLSGMMTNCAKLHYSFTSTAWIGCKVMPDCAKGIRLDVESMDVLDITILSNSSAPQFCANLSGMMTNCAKLHYSFTSTAWIWCKTMPDCAKERRLDVGIWCKTMLDCANERRLDVESADVLDITLWQNKQQLSGFHYLEKSNDNK